SPAVEFIEASQYCVFTFRLEALTLRFGARSGLRIGRLGVLWLRRERRLQGRRLFWRAVIQRLARWSAAAWAPPRAPFLDPLRRRCALEPLGFVDAKPKHG